MIARVLPVLCSLVVLSGICGSQNRSIPLEVPLVSANSNVGWVIFRETMQGGLNIDVRVQALTRGEHAVHIHQNPTCDSPDFRTAGPHFNPDGKKHGWKNPNGHHAGDLADNVLVDANGNGHINVTTYDLNLTLGSAHSVLGRSILVHERADDMKTDPAGGSGNRIACGVIQSAPRLKPE